MVFRNITYFIHDRYLIITENIFFLFFQPDSNIVDDNERANMTIKIKMDKCTDFQDVNCIGSVTLTYQSAIIKLEGEKLFINHVDYSETIRKTPYSFNGLYVKEVTNKFRVVKAFGLKILYDKKRTLYIDLKPFYANKVRKLNSIPSSQSSTHIFTCAIQMIQRFRILPMISFSTISTLILI